MKIFFVVPYPKGEAPSQRFRFEQYLNFIGEVGETPTSNVPAVGVPPHRTTHTSVDVSPHHTTYEFHSFWTAKEWKQLYKPGNKIAKVFALIKGYLRRWKLMIRLRKADFVFIHREVAPLGPPIFEFIIAKILRKKIIYDYDDAIWLHNSNMYKTNPLLYMARWPRKVKTICKWSYKISCGNKYLADFGLLHSRLRKLDSQDANSPLSFGEGAGGEVANVFLVPTTIDTVKSHNQTKNQHTEKVVIGWTGTHSTMPYLNLIEDALKKLEEKYDFDFIVISNKKPALNLRSLIYFDWKEETEVSDLMKINIGIMPSKTDEWAKGKCGFKAIQFMSLGIPTVATPIGVNFEIIKHGVNGYLCATNEEWFAALEKLLLDENLRTEFGKKAQEEIAHDYSVLANKQKFLNLFTNL